MSRDSSQLATPYDKRVLSISPASDIVTAVVALRAQGDQIFQLIVPSLGARLLVMNFEIGAFATELTLPAIALEYLQPKLLVGCGVKPLSAHG